MLIIDTQHDSGLASGWSGALILQYFPFSCWYVVNCCSKISMAFISSCDIHKYLVSMSYCEHEGVSADSLCGYISSW